MGDSRSVHAPGTSASVTVGDAGGGEEAIEWGEKRGGEAWGVGGVAFGWWGFGRGGVDAGEQPITALYREVMEETGWIIGRPKKIGAFRRFVYMPEYNMRAEKLCHIYLAKPILKITFYLQTFHYLLLKF